MSLAWMENSWRGNIKGGRDARSICFRGRRHHLSLVFCGKSGAASVDAWGMADNARPEPGLVLDGYTFVRPLGQGGFGTVWLVSSAATGGYGALKWISGSALEHEWSAVKLFREVSQRLRSPHLIAVEHVNRTRDALYYTLPLADGGPGDDPADPAWRPLTLGDLVEQKRGGPWFSSREVLGLFLPVARVAVDLNNEGLVHRDIKPANILFFGGRPCLADIGLLGADRAGLSVKGTPGHIPPSWYEGEPDMWGLATTLYVLLTGNEPDTMGRANFRWPPGGEDSLSAEEKDEWLRLHAVVLRATEENPGERFIGLGSFVDAVAGEEASAMPPEKPSRSPRLLALALLAALGIASAWAAYNFWLEPKNAQPPQEVADLQAKVDKMSAEWGAERDALEKARKPNPEITRSVNASMERLKAQQADAAESLKRSSEGLNAALDKIKAQREQGAGNQQ